MDQRARDPRVQDVADDRHRQTGEVLLVVADRVRVEQPLRRVGMAAVAGVDHVPLRPDVARDHVRRPALRVAHDEHVGMHRRQVVDGVEQRLALGRRGRADVEVDHVGRQALGRDLERRAGARGVLEEDVEHAHAAEQRHLLHLALGDAEERLRGVQDAHDDLARQPLERQQVRELAVRVELRVTCIVEPQGKLPGVVPVEAQHLALRDRERRAAVLRADRQLPLAAVDERHQRDRLRPAVVEQLVHRGPDGAAGVEDVVDEEELPVGDVERNLARLHRLVEARLAVVVAVERDVEPAERDLEPELAVQALGEPGAAGVDADHPGRRRDRRLELLDQLRAKGFGVRQLHRGRSGPAG